ncbi:hypothetical protein [Halobaculum marinum]|uniref:LEA14-like dessication related protein n=1 Tax=Halobaculum marinum TaxID=3031996 RepID=A0ABD5WWW0_9EURY|nr:hypothetical protein [Halobaculum sp. DT55]
MWVPLADRRTSLVVVGVLAVVSVAVAAPVVSSHVAANHLDRVTVTSQSVSATDDGSELRATLRLTNPTPAAITVPDRGGIASVRASNDDTTLTRLRGVSVDGATVPAGGSASITLGFDVREDHRERVATDLGSVTLTGTVPADVGGRSTALSVDSTAGVR